ncbi:unnamed protein product [Blepharisma stoltei]|uniref:Uncharacterized protein n=1 Tax=Blepharisma stoltei TaxID=1481888 RepID=A0AAU9IEP1_9CILI|nr:unnamed protein product [Blepharisma stoltei]
MKRSYNLTPTNIARSDTCPPSVTPRHACSPEVARNIIKLSKIVYNNKHPVSKIKVLEKQAIRGEFEPALSVTPKQKQAFSFKLSPRLVKSPIKNPDLSNFPKLPFGKHSSCNADQELSFEKIKAKTPKPDFNNKFSFGHDQKSPSSKFLNLNSSNYQVYDTKAGVLVCLKEKEVINSYEKEKNKWAAMLKMYQTFRDIEEEKRWRKKIKEVLNRGKKFEMQEYAPQIFTEEDLESEETGDNTKNVARHLKYLQNDL